LKVNKMTTEYKWSIVQMDRKTVDGFVTTVHYNVSATDGTNNASTYGTVNFSDEPETMVPFEDLTKSMVTEWVQTSLGKETVEASLQSQLDALAAPVSASGLPW